jgi:NTE family protein
MSSSASGLRPRPRIGLALGAGGVTGHAFHAGVLAALHEALDWDARTADVIVGTSAGSVVGSLLRAGMAPADMAARSLDAPLSPEGARLVARSEAVAPGGMPARPRRNGLPRMAAPGLLVRAAFRPIWMTRPGVVLAGAMPAGTIATEFVSAGIRPHFEAHWPESALWLPAVRLSDGRRVVFGRAGAPRADVADAVAASCAIPGFFEPVKIDGDRYVDGGAHSPTNADLLAGHDPAFDLVIVSSPMSVTGPRPRRALDVPARRLCRMLLAREVGRIRRDGVAVLTFQPTADDIAAMGVNAMDPGRRGAVTRQARVSALRKLERDDVRALVERLAPAGQPA